ncbi:hypothetical protein [Paraburkholderia pallida]|nr:hypothetical protein [Paraburkholderia pallida]
MKDVIAQSRAEFAERLSRSGAAARIPVRRAHKALETTCKEKARSRV